jgi:hypothetical protein
VAANDVAVLDDASPATVDAGVADEHERPWWETDPRLTDRFGQA